MKTKTFKEIKPFQTDARSLESFAANSLTIDA